MITSQKEIYLHFRTRPSFTADLDLKTRIEDGITYEHVKLHASTDNDGSNDCPDIL